MMKYATMDEFLLSRTIEEPGPMEAPCLIWAGCKKYGYGCCLRPGMPSTDYVHRARWIFKHGPITDGLVVDHICCNKACCNLDHLELVTRRENTIRGYTARIGSNAGLVCRNGHPLRGENLRIRMRKYPIRQCGACEREKRQKKAVSA